MPQPEQAIYLDGIKQPIYYYRLPKSVSGKLLVNMPRVIYEAVDTWVTLKTPKRLILEDSGVRFTLYDAVVDVDIIGLNRYGALSHDLTISCTNMVRGAYKEKKK